MVSVIANRFRLSLIFLFALAALLSSVRSEQDSWGEESTSFGDVNDQLHQIEQDEDQAQRNARFSASFIEQYAAQEGVIKLDLDNNIFYRILQSGPNPAKRPGLSTLCRIHYQLAVVIDGSPVETDSSYRRGEPLQTEASKLIQGWQLVLPNMAEGDKWEVAIPPELGYGVNGAGEHIPPNSALVVEIFLVAVEPDLPVLEQFAVFLSKHIPGLPIKLKVWQGLMLCVYIGFRLLLVRRQKARMAIEAQLKRQAAANEFLAGTAQGSKKKN
jgi:FKBP-type peptidyl-prolyl cis-trans isomerase